MRKKFLLALLFIALSLPSLSDAWDGKVIGIKDCGEIIVFDGTNLPVSVSLRGVDMRRACPQQAKQFVSNSVFGKMVTIQDDKKREGGFVAEVVMGDGKSLNKELLKQDFMRSAVRETPRTNPPSVRIQNPVSSQGSVKKDFPPSVGPYPGPTAVPGVRKWRDKNGNIHFSGTVGGKE